MNNQNMAITSNNSIPTERSDVSEKTNKFK